MEEKEIVRRYEMLTKRSRVLVNKLNQFHEAKEKLRQEYETLTGKDISERHKSR